MGRRKMFAWLAKMVLQTGGREWQAGRLHAARHSVRPLWPKDVLVAQRCPLDTWCASSSVKAHQRSVTIMPYNAHLDGLGNEAGNVKNVWWLVEL